MLAVLVTLEAVLDDGPMTICETVVTGIETIVGDGAVVADGRIAVAVPLIGVAEPPGNVAVFGVLWDVAGLVLIVRDGTPGTVAHAVANARKRKCMNNQSIKEIIDGKKKIRTVDEALCTRNNANRGIISNGAIDASLYARGIGRGTDATSCGAGLGKHKMNEICNLRKKF